MHTISSYCTSIRVPILVLHYFLLYTSCSTDNLHLLLYISFSFSAKSDTHPSSETICTSFSTHPSLQMICTSFSVFLSPQNPIHFLLNRCIGCAFISSQILFQTDSYAHLQMHGVAANANARLLKPKGSRSPSLTCVVDWTRYISTCPYFVRIYMCVFCPYLVTCCSLFFFLYGVLLR